MAHKHSLSCLDGACPSPGRPSTKAPLRERVLQQVAQNGGVTNSAIIASNLQLKYATVQRCADKLRDEGKIERDENDAWILTDSEFQERDTERQFRESLVKLRRR